MPYLWLQEYLSRFQSGTAEKLNLTDSAFCILPFIHLHITQQGTQTACCQAPWGKETALGDTGTETLKEIWDGEKMAALRQNMLSGVRDPRCSRCYAKEAAGVTSFRQNMNRLHSDKLEQVIGTGRPLEQPVFWDIRFSNQCNFRCRICNAESSSQWHEDAVALGYKSPDAPKLSRSFTDAGRFSSMAASWIPQLEEIYFAGGEPLIMEEHYRLLDMLEAADKQDVLLRYATNFSVVSYKGRSVFDRWKKFRRVIVSASVDDRGKRAEYQRKGQDYDLLVRNRMRMMEECPDAWFMISPTLSMFNFFSFPDLHREWTERGLIFAEDCFPTVLEEPHHLHFRNLPARVKAEARSKWEIHIQWLEKAPSRFPFLRDMLVRECRNILKSLEREGSAGELKQFCEETARLDALRNEDYASVFEESKWMTDAQELTLWKRLRQRFFS